MINERCHENRPGIRPPDPRWLTVAVCLFMALTAPGTIDLHGQAAPQDAADAFCWRGKALPACRSFALFELEVARAVASTKILHQREGQTFTEYPFFGNELTWNLGAMRNMSQEWALGGTVSLGTGSPGILTGMRLRARRWLSPPGSAELEAGIFSTGINQRVGSGMSWGPTVGVRLNVADRFSVVSRWEAAHASAGSDGFFEREAGLHHGLYLGASAGGTIAVAGTAVIGAVALFVLVALNQSDF